MISGEESIDLHFLGALFGGSFGGNRLPIVSSSFDHGTICQWLILCWSLRWMELVIQSKIFEVIKYFVSLYDFSYGFIRRITFDLNHR